MNIQAPDIKRSNTHYKTPEEAFAARTVKDEISGCLNWTGCHNSNGYGNIRVGGQLISAHRFAWEQAHGPIPNSLHCLHRCDNRKCCNANHPKGGTHPRAKLVEADIPRIRADTRLHRIIAADYGVDRTTISDIKRVKIWRHV